MTPHSQNSLAFASTVLFNILKYSLCIFCHDIKITELGTRDNSQQSRKCDPVFKARQVLFCCLVAENEYVKKTTFGHVGVFCTEICHFVALSVSRN